MRTLPRLIPPSQHASGGRRYALVALVLVAAAVLGRPGTVLAQQQRLPAFEDRSVVIGKQLFTRGLTFARLGEHDKALSAYEKALQVVPNEAAILSAMADAHEALGDATTALFYAEQARDAAPDNPFFHRQYAELQLRSGHMEAAVAAYDVLLRRFPDDHDALEQLAQLQSMMGQTREALATYQQLIDQAGDEPDLRRQMLQLYFRLGDEDGTKRTLEALVDLDPEDPAPWRLLGQLYLQQNHELEALEAFEEAFDANPNDFETILALSDLYRQLDREEEAEALLDDALNIGGATPAELMTRAAPLYSRARQDREAAQAAVQLLQRAVDLAPDNADALSMLGDLRFRSGHYAEAADLLSRALEQNPRDPDLWLKASTASLEAGHPERAASVADEGLLLFPGQLPLLRVAAYSLMRLDRTADAIDRFEEAVAISLEDAPDDESRRSDFYGALGLLYSRTDDFETADQYFERALRAGPGDADALARYALSLAERGERLDDALRMARRAVSLQAENASFMDALGWVYFKRGALEQAAEWLVKATVAAPRRASAFDHLGDVRAQQGDVASARANWQKALDLDPGNDALRRKLEQRQP